MFCNLSVNASLSLDDDCRKSMEIERGASATDVGPSIATLISSLIFNSVFKTNSKIFKCVLNCELYLYIPLTIIFVQEVLV